MEALATTSGLTGCGSAAVTAEGSRIVPSGPGTADRAQAPRHAGRRRRWPPRRQGCTWGRVG